MHASQRKQKSTDISSATGPFSRHKNSVASGTCHKPCRLDVLRQALAHLAGQHDFGAFSAQRGKPSGDTIRTIQKVALAHRGELLTLSFQGDGFLYKMVRMLTAAIVRVAQGRDTLESLQSRLKTGVPKSNHVAPPDGLTLMRVLY